MKENWHNDDGKTYASSGCLPGCLCTLAVGAMIATTCYTAYKNPNSIKEYSNLAIDETTDLTSVIKQRGYSKISDNPIFAKNNQEYRKIMKINYFPNGKQDQVSITYGLINVNTKVEEVPLGIYNYISDNITVYNNKNYLEVQKMNGENGLLSMTDFTYLPATIVNNDTEAKVRKLTK